ncbi:MAG: GMC oxidoreductase [Thalassovita sp.]
MSDTADVIVIGSGFGGAVAAARLVEAGKSVILLERGPWRDTIATRSAGIKGRQPLPCEASFLSLIRSVHPKWGPKRLTLNKYGYLEMFEDAGIKVPVTSNVGGGSQIWAAVIDRPKAGYWDNRANGLSDATMSPHYERLAAQLGATQPKDTRKIANHTDHAWQGADFFTQLDSDEQPPMGILFQGESTVVDENGISRQPFAPGQENGKFGSPGATKSTLDALFLIPAIRKGMDLRALHEVRRIQKTGTGFTVTARNLKGRRKVTLTAAKVIVAAGTMNTNALLLKATQAGDLPVMPALGQGVGMNGDLLGKWATDGRDASLGPPVQGRVKITGHEAAAYVLLSTAETPPLPFFMRKKALEKARSTLGLVAMSQDASDGRIWLENGRFRFAFHMSGSPSYAATMQAYDALGQASGRKVKYSKEQVVSAHPCGGCRVSDGPQTGVVDGRGQVHGCAGLYVADAAALPQSLGVPPSLSIAAWAAHVATEILSET